MSSASASFRIGQVQAYLRNKIWYLCYHESGRRHRPRIGPDRASAKQMAAQINGQLAVGTLDALSFEPITSGPADRHGDVSISFVQTRNVPPATILLTRPPHPVLNMRCTLSTALVLFVGSCLFAEVPKQPNILFILADDQSYKTVHCYPESYPWAKTPNIDRLAQTGVRFDRAYLGAWCMPSRASLLTGRHPHGIESMRMDGEYPGSTYDPKQCRFWPSVFREYGYHTAQIGKWHTGTDTGFSRDWDHQIVWNRPKHPNNAGNYYEKQLVAFNGEERTVEGYSTDNYTKWASEYIRGAHRPKDKPWYLWLCYGAVHGPSIPAKRHLGLYKDAKVPVPADIFPPRLGKPKYLDETQAWSKGPGGEPVMGTNGGAKRIEPRMQLEAPRMRLGDRVSQRIVTRRHALLAGEKRGPRLLPRSVERIARRTDLEKNGVQLQLRRAIQ